MDQESIINGNKKRELCKKLDKFVFGTERENLKEHGTTVCMTYRYLTKDLQVIMY